MQTCNAKSSLIVSETPESRRRNFQITCTGDHINWCFYSGSEGNKIEIIVQDGKVGIGAEKTTWQESLKITLKRYAKVFAGIFCYTLGGAM